MTITDARPVVSPAEEKTGCLWCPLLPWSEDFENWEPNYNRAADKILAKEPDGHTVLSRCCAEPHWSEVEVLFVGEAPGAAEDKKALPFVGPSGRILRTSIPEFMSIAPSKVGFTNVVRCRPPRNRTPNNTEIKSCTPDLIRELEIRKPKVVVALGNTPLTFLTGQSGITSFNGKVLSCVVEGFESLPVVGCLHPAYVARFSHELDAFADALHVANAVAQGTYESPLAEGEYFTLSDLDEVRTLFESFTESQRKVYFDSETGALEWWQDEFPRLLCLSFSDEVGFGFVVPWDHAESPWRIGGPKEEEREEVAELIRSFFVDESIPKCAQNGQFDFKHIRFAFDVIPTNTTDTMHTHLTLDERRGSHGLKSLTYSYSGMGGYEKELDKYIDAHRECSPDHGGSYANIPGDVLFPYAAMDADATARVDAGLRAEKEFQSNERLQRLSDEFFPRLSRALSDMEFQGAQIDSEVVTDLDLEYTDKMEEIAAAILELPTVQAFQEWRWDESGNKGCVEDYELNPKSPKQLQRILFGADFYGEKPVHLTKTGLEKLNLRFQNTVVKWAEDGKKGPEPDFIGVVTDAYSLGQVEYFSTDAEVLQELDRRGNELANRILEFRGYQTLHGTFIKPLLEKLDPEGRVHGTFLLHGTVTGRLASLDPNLQNIPNKGGGRIKRAYVSRFGDEGVIGQVDFSQIELRIAASWFREPNMIAAYQEGADVHTLTALQISNTTQEEYDSWSVEERESWEKTWRVRAKRINFGILYGGGPNALVNTLRKDGVFITTDEAQHLIDLYFSVRPALKAGIDRLEKSVKRHGYLQSFTGRKRRVPEVRADDPKVVSRALRQSVNFPIQSGASDMTLMALTLIHEAMQEEGYESRLILTVHDSLVFDLHVDEFEKVMCLAKTIMENLPQHSDDLLPGLDWSWSRTPIVADCELGWSWGSLVKFDPFDYDVDDLWERMSDKAVVKMEDEEN